MSWEILMDADFEDWVNNLDRTERVKIMGYVGLLREHGPNLGRPYVDGVKGSKYSQLKELRVQIAGDPWRVLFAFDTARVAILLVGGNKGGDKRWYKTHVPIADTRFERHLTRSAR
jgi:hypothetical protein